MDATCKIQDGIHMPRIIKKCVQDSGYISICSRYFTYVILESRCNGAFEVFFNEFYKEGIAKYSQE